ncbi:MAG: glycosyltransferase family 4 protein, partial [Candidatus Lokiarchaeota archaeon]|nr:glycosyltransferase family 4 protein [Candidatus Lokiarchaeota archaeon]
FFPEKGGIPHTINSMCKYFKYKEHTLIILNPNYKGENIHKLLNKTYSFKKLLKIGLKKSFPRGLITIFKSLLKDRKISLFERINFIMFLLSKPPTLIKTINNFQRIYPFLRSTDFDVIVTSDSGNLLILGVILSKLFNKKLVALAHGLDFLIKSYFSLKYFYFKNTDMFILSNNWLKNMFQKIYNISDEKIDIINRGMFFETYHIEESKEILRKKYNIPNNQFVLLSVGRHTWRKNFQLVIKAIKKIKDIEPNINLKYYLVGKGEYTPELKILVRKLGLIDDIKFLGILENNIRNEFYKLSDLFLMPSISKKNDIEGFGIVFLEANYYKVPVIGSASGGIVEAISDGENGFLVKPNNLDDLVEKIITLYHNKDLCIQMGEIGYKRVLKDYDWKKIGEQYEKTFKKVINL